MNTLAYRVHMTLRSTNKKVGPIPVSTTDSGTCPPICAFYDSGCYAHYGPISHHWSKVTRGERGDPWPQFCMRVTNLPDGQLWRHNQAGDLPGDGWWIDTEALKQLVEANRGKRGFTYTHYPVLGDDDCARHNRAAIRQANERGFRINLSGNHPAHADELADLGIAPVTTVLATEQRHNTVTPAGRRVVVCPATTHEGVTCMSCQLCQRNHDVIVGFPAHGTKRRAVSEVVWLGLERATGT